MVCKKKNGNETHTTLLSTLLLTNWREIPACLLMSYFQFQSSRWISLFPTLLTGYSLCQDLESIISSKNILLCINCDVSLSVICRALVEDLLCLCQLSTVVVQSLMTQCMFGWRTWILEVSKFASGNSCLLTENIKTQLWYAPYTKYF